MKKIILLFIITAFIFSCGEQSRIKLTVKKKDAVKDGVKNTVIENEVKRQKAGINDYVGLFFENSLQTVSDIKPRGSNDKKDLIDPADYKAVIEWLVENGRRKVKFKNIRTNEEFILTEGDNSGNMALIERSLMSYTIRIKNSVIKVKR